MEIKCRLKCSNTKSKIKVNKVEPIKDPKKREVDNQVNDTQHQLEHIYQLTNFALWASTKSGVDASTKEVYWPSSTSMSTAGEQVLKYRYDMSLRAQ
jgi:hypothetical protein